MCTCINFKTHDFYFGRTLDLEYRFAEKVVVTPKKYEFPLKKAPAFSTKYAIIGMAAVVDNYPLYAEAANEKGLAAAGLYFPDNAHYAKESDGKFNITPFELIPWILGNFANIDEFIDISNKLNIVDIPFSSSIPLTHLHWMVSDKNSAIVLEQTKNGLNIYNNSVGVLTNNPQFSYHTANLHNYLNLSAKPPINRFSKKAELGAYSQGMGSIGLPGDTSSSSRFVRAAFNKLNSACLPDEANSVTQFFHILDSVSLVRGSTITPDDKYDITNYSCCINTTKGIYYYKTYENSQISAIALNEKNINSKTLDIYELIENQQINYIN